MIVQKILFYLRLYPKKNIVICDPMPELTITQLFTPTTKGNGWSGKDLSYGLSTLYLSANLQNNKYLKGEYGEGRGKG
jgi:hypothetical protein